MSSPSPPHDSPIDDSPPSDPRSKTAAHAAVASTNPTVPVKQTPTPPQPPSKRSRPSARDSFRTAPGIESAREVKEDLGEMGFTAQRVKQFGGRKETRLPDGQVSKRRLEQAADWALFDPLRGYPDFLGKEKETLKHSEPPSIFQQYETYEPGNQRVVEFNIISRSLRLRTTPAMLSEGRMELQYTSTGPKLVDVRKSSGLEARREQRARKEAEAKVREEVEDSELSDLDEDELSFGERVPIAPAHSIPTKAYRNCTTHVLYKINPLSKKPFSGNYYALRERARALPVAERLDDILAAVEQHNVVIIQSETGSGKTTQVPKALIDQEYTRGKKIALTQNRVLAAQLVAQRIAEELDVEVGGAVGLKHRDADRTSRLSRLDVLTDGSLLQAAQSDSTLSAYGVIVIDEAHHHTVATDLLLGLLKDLSAGARKHDLKIIIMSATIDAAMFSSFYPGSMAMQIHGREHENLVHYLPVPAAEDCTNDIVETILRVHLTGQSGNILVFASGVREIQKIIAKVKAALTGPSRAFTENEVGSLDCYALHASLSPEQRDAAVQNVPPPPIGKHTSRKVIVATNTAETSVTLAGVTFVIDSCRVKNKIWNPRDESWNLREQFFSKAQAGQRSGGAGRTRPGMAYRMCTERGFNDQILDHSVAAILEDDMLGPCLSILKMGYNPRTFPYIVAPATETIVKALEILFHLGAINGRGDITADGKTIARIPVNDLYSAVALLRSPDYRCSDAMLSLVAIMDASEGGPTLFQPAVTPRDKAVLRTARDFFFGRSGDHIGLFNAFMAWQKAKDARGEEVFLTKHKLVGSILRAADRTRLRLFTTMTRDKSWKLCLLPTSEPGYHMKIIRALAAGYFLNVARRDPSDAKSQAYETVRYGARAKLDDATNIGLPRPSNDWVIYGEYSSDGGAKRTLRLVSAIPLQDLIAAEPGYWCDAEFLRPGHIQDGVVSVLATMTGESEDEVRGGMPRKPEPSERLAAAAAP
ncbi:DEAH-box ATP-dependent RNA helicase prp43 [Friedmanniomyces endolithicus]|nr:DEAH-box ATP-dependent RNA helicase prp43 [Friedmanniomyces endolithicus]